MYFCYILRSDVNFNFYKGHTQDLSIRLKMHNQGKVFSTKNGRPWRLIYFETFKTREEAIAREKYFKSAAGRRFIQNKFNTQGGSLPDC